MISSTLPLPTQRPWSGGSKSVPIVFASCALLRPSQPARRPVCALCTVVGLTVGTHDVFGPASAVPPSEVRLTVGRGDMLRSTTGCRPVPGGSLVGPDAVGPAAGNVLVWWFRWI